MFIKHQPDANINYDGTTLLHFFCEGYKKDAIILLILFFNADLTLNDDKGKTPLDYLQDKIFKKYLEEDIAKLRGNINETCGTDATDFVLHYFEQNPDKSITDHIKDLPDNSDQLMDKYIYDAGSPAERAKISDPKDSPSTSLNAAKVEESSKNYLVK